MDLRGLPLSFKIALAIRLAFATILFLVSMPIWIRFHPLGFVLSILVAALFAFKLRQANKIMNKDETEPML